jgi:hypothetical protein
MTRIVISETPDAETIRKLQAFDPDPLAEAIEDLDRGISRLIWGAVVVAVIAALALWGWV